MRVALVVSRYGSHVLGGAESQARGFAQEAARRGWAVEVWTTCARSHHAWENVYPAGAETLAGVLVRRFPIDRWDPHRWIEIEDRLASLGVLPVDGQYAWLAAGAHSASLYRHIADRAADFDVLIVLQYAVPLAHYAAWGAPERVVMWPCLHDEPYAYMEPTHLLLESVWGVMFNSPEERDLAIGLLGMRPARYAVLGEGACLDAPPSTASAGNGSYLLYMGRLERGKNLSLLYAYVRQYVENGGKVRLVVLGDGPLKPPTHPAFDYQGFVSEEAKSATCANALALCQPSLRESFSLTIMESWLAGRPVLVHSECAVTCGHVRRSRGGLWFRTYDEFVESVGWLANHRELASRMGRNGREYVLRNYTWQAVVDRFERILAAWRLGEGR